MEVMITDNNYIVLPVMKGYHLVVGLLRLLQSLSLVP